MVNRWMEERLDEWTIPGDNTSEELKLKPELKWIYGSYSMGLLNVEFLEVIIIRCPQVC